MGHPDFLEPGGLSFPLNPLLYPLSSQQFLLTSLRFSLAYCEMYLTLGTLFRRFHNLKVYKTTPADLEYDDFFSSYHVPGNWLKAVGRDSEDGEKSGMGG